MLFLFIIAFVIIYLYNSTYTTEKFTKKKRPVKKRSNAPVQSECVINGNFDTITFPKNKSSFLPGEILTSCRGLRSSNGRYVLAFQSDGNLVLFNGKTKKPIWDTGTSSINCPATLHCVPPSETGFQMDVILKDSNGHPQWYSGTAKGMTALKVQDDGDFVLYNGSEIIWQAKNDAPFYNSANV